MSIFTHNIRMMAAMFAIAGVIQSSAQEKTLDMSVSGITCVDATVSVVPSDDTAGYYWSYRTKAEFEANGGADGIIATHIAAWERMGDMYYEPWQNIMVEYLRKGPHSASLKEVFDSKGLMWGTDYVVYAFGMDASGEVTIPLQVKEFSTLPQSVSDNTFDIKVISVVPDGNKMTTTFSVVPSNDDPYVVRTIEKRFTDAFDIAPGSQGETDFVRNYIIPNVSGIYSGQQVITVEGQTADRDFCIAAVGMEGGAPSTPLALTYYRTEEMQPQKAEFKVEVSDVTQTNARIKVTPPSDDMLYYWYITTEESIERHGGRDVVDVNLDRAWYEYVSELYGGNPTWQELMLKGLTTGDLDGYLHDMPEAISSLRWDTDYVLYAYGLNEQCERITDIAFFDFHTAACNQTDLTFDFEVVSVEDDPENTTSMKECKKVTIDILPSDENAHFATKYADVRTLDAYEASDMYTVDDYIYDQFMGYCMMIDGPARMVMPGIEVGKNYYLISIGWDEAPNTELFRFRFNTDVKPAGIEALEADKVTVTAVDGGIRVDGPFGYAAVYGLDGRLAGALRHPGTLALPAGVYAVRYDVGGQTVTEKVAVR